MNQSIPTGQRGNTRDIGLDPSMHNAAGKGDASRITDLTQFKTNLDDVALPRIPCAEDPNFVKTKRGFKKVYGKQTTADAVELVAPPLPVSKNEIAPEL